MTKRATRQSSTRRPASKAKRKPAPRRAQRPGMLDQAIAALPISEATLRKLATWSILGVATAAALGVATWFGIPSAMGIALAEGIGRAGFRVEQIDVTGVHHMDVMTVNAVALDQQSRAMPLVDLKKVRERLLAYPWVQDARVSRRLPNTLAIDIVERTPAAIWQDNGQLMLIDGTGAALAPVDPQAMPALPLLIGDNANAHEADYRALLDAAPALKPLVKAANWVGNRRWNLIFNSGEKLLLPEGDDAAPAALKRFAELDGTQRLLGRGYVQFDMRIERQLTVRTAGNGSSTTQIAPAAQAPAAPVDQNESAPAQNSQ